MKTWTEIQQQWNRPRRPGSFRDLAEAMKWELRREQETAGESGKQRANTGRGPAFGAPILSQSEEEPRRPRFDSIRKLAESFRQEAGQVERELREQAARESIESGEDDSGNQDSFIDSPAGIEAGYKPPPFGGNFINNSDITIFIVGEPGFGTGSKIREIKPGERDAAWYDADFFKLHGTWYKILECNVTISGRNGDYKVHGDHDEADPEVAQGYENMLRRYLKNKKG